MYVHPTSGHRQCLTCKRERTRETMRKLRADPAYREPENARLRDAKRARYRSDREFRAAETKRRQAYRKRKAV